MLITPLQTGRKRSGEGANSAFTLIEILCVLGLLAMVAAIGAPSLIRSRAKAQASVCIDQLKQLNAAQQQWVIEAKPASDAKIKKKDLQPYFKGGVFPTCPSGGNYKLGGLTDKPECSLDKKEGHQL